SVLGTRFEIAETCGPGANCRVGSDVVRLRWRVRRAIAIALTTTLGSAVAVVTIVPASEVAVHAAPCEVFDHGVRVSRDPCPANAPMPTCTTFDGAGGCSRWLLFLANGATQLARECDIDEYPASALTRVPT